MANYSKETFQTIYEEWKESGLPVRYFCYQNGFRKFKFYYWRRKMSGSSQLTKTGSFVPVSLKQSSGKIELSNRTDLLGNVGTEGSTCYIEYPNGVCLHINGEVSLEVLRSLVTLQN